MLLLAVAMIILASVTQDISFIISQFRERKSLSHYIDFEKGNVKERKQIIIDRIQTSIAFKSEKRRLKYERFTHLDTKSLKDLEKDILTLYPGISTLDSIPFHNSDIVNARSLMLNTRNVTLKHLYEKLLFLPMLETLAMQVFDDSGEGLSSWQLFRPITEDSTYIGAQHISDGISKCAFRLNGQYFPETYLGIYTISKRDTVNIETLNIRKKWTYIDTIINEQTIVNHKGTWRNIGFDLPQKY